MHVEIWSDVVCPWCYIGKRRFEQALARFPHQDEVEVSWRSFQLDPGAARESGETTSQVLARKYGMSLVQVAALNNRMEALAAEIGLEYHLGGAPYVNTFDAHRLVHLARSHSRQDAMMERLMRAHFTQNRPLGDVETLIQLGTDVGLDPIATRAMVESDGYATEVNDDRENATKLGIRGVPFFVVDRRLGVSGAQSSDILFDLLERAWETSRPHTRPGTREGVTFRGTDECTVVPARLEAT